MEEPLLRSLKLTVNKLECQEPHFNKLLFLLFVDQRLGILRYSQELGGFIMIKFQNLLQLESFCQQALLWYEARETFYSLIEWKWVLHFYSKLIISLQKDIWMIEKFISNNKKNLKNRLSRSLNKKNKIINNSLPSLVFRPLQNKK
jgi:hypothetical protein